MNAEKLADAGKELWAAIQKAYDATADLSYALKLNWTGGRPSDGKTGVAAFKAESQFVPANEAAARLQQHLDQATILLGLLRTLGIDQIGPLPKKD